VLFGDSFESLIFLLQLLIAVSLERKPACRRVRPGDLRQTAVSDLSKVILCPVALRFEHSTLVARAKLHNHSAIAA
jgi:hypothetical protein